MYLRTLMMSLYCLISPLLSLLQCEAAQRARKSAFGGVFDRKRAKSQGALRYNL